MHKFRIPFAREGLWPVLVSLGLVVLLFWIHPLAALPALPFFLFLFWFFRSPDRKIDTDPEVLLSPADGKVMSVVPVEYNPMLGGPGVRVSIFMSVFSVHVNRAPCSGNVTLVEYREGSFLPAYKSHACELNERNSLLIDCETGDRRVRVNQITGMLARRIVCDVRQGNRVEQGARFGMIKLGSCAELVMPPTCAVLVRPGQAVRAGKTVVASWR